MGNLFRLKPGERNRRVSNCPKARARFTVGHDLLTEDYGAKASHAQPNSLRTPGASPKTRNRNEISSLDSQITKLA